MVEENVTRRRALAALAASGTATVAGCVGSQVDPDEETPMVTPTDTPTESPTATPVETPTETPTDGPGEACIARFEDSFERFSLGSEFVPVRLDGRIELTSEHAHSGQRSLLMASETDRSLTAVESTACFEGALSVRTALKRIEHEEGSTAATVALVDAEERSWPKLSVNVWHDGKAIDVKQFNEEGRVTTTDWVYGFLPLGVWEDIVLTVGEGTLGIQAGGDGAEVETATDWSSRPFVVELGVRDSGEADGVTAAFDDVRVDPA